MPLGYGGGINNLEEIGTILGVGVEKVCINTHAFENPGFVRAAADSAGSQSVVVSIDVKRSALGKYEVVTHCGQTRTGWDPVRHAVRMQEMGAGEVVLTSVDRDGTMGGYDWDLIRQVASAVDIPVVACGGAGKIADLAEAVRRGGASAASAGSLFVFQGKHRAVLISFPSQEELKEVFAGG